MLWQAAALSLGPEPKCGVGGAMSSNALAPGAARGILTVPCGCLQVEEDVESLQRCFVRYGSAGAAQETGTWVRLGQADAGGSGGAAPLSSPFQSDAAADIWTQQAVGGRAGECPLLWCPHHHPTAELHGLQHRACWQAGRHVLSCAVLCCCAMLRARQAVPSCCDATSARERGGQARMC